MPVDIKLNMVKGRGEFLMRRSPENKAEEGLPFMSLPVAELVAEISPNAPTILRATFVSIDQEAVLSMCELADPLVYTTVCFFCHAQLRRKSIQVTSNPRMSKPVWVWVCDCQGDVGELHDS